MDNILKYRRLADKAAQLHVRKRGRILILTGARQTGKTTLAQQVFADHQYISMEDPATRVDFSSLTAGDWIARYPHAVIDEVQKLPQLFEVIKAAYDANPDVSYVLLGSSQILLLKKVKESLAGRAALQELFPLTLPEMMSHSWDEAMPPSRLSQLIELSQPHEIRELLEAELSIAPHYHRANQCWQEFLTIGGMPALYSPDFTPEDKWAWLEDYQFTYLQRDLVDLVQLDHLEPFVCCQRALAMKSAHEINYSELARLSDVTAPTAKRFLQYLELSYQTFMLPAYARNMEKRLAKMPKVHFLDPGVRRGILRRRGNIEDHEFESAVIAEIYKQLRTVRAPVNFFHLRTFDKREVDLLLEAEQGYFAIECKQTARVGARDFRHLRHLDRYLDKPLLAGLVVGSERAVRVESEQPLLLSVPAPWLLS